MSLCQPLATPPGTMLGAGPAGYAQPLHVLDYGRNRIESSYKAFKPEPIINIWKKENKFEYFVDPLPSYKIKPISTFSSSCDNSSSLGGLSLSSSSNKYYKDCLSTLMP